MMAIRGQIAVFVLVAVTLVASSKERKGKFIDFTTHSSFPFAAFRIGCQLVLLKIIVIGMILFYFY